MFNNLFKSSTPTTTVAALSAVLQLPGGTRRVVPVTGPTLNGLFETAAREAGAPQGTVRLIVDGRPIDPNALVSTFVNLSTVIVEASEFQSTPATTISGGGAGATILETTDPCAICLEVFGPGAPAIRAGSACSHGFHLPCLTEWRSRSAFCPLCRAPMGGPAPTVTHTHYDAPTCGGGGGSVVTTTSGGGGNVNVSGAAAAAAALTGGATYVFATAPSATDVLAMIEATRLRVKANPEWQRLVAALRSPQAVAIASAAGGVALVAAGGAIRSAVGAARTAAPILSFIAGTAANMAVAAVSTAVVTSGVGAGAALAPHTPSHLNPFLNHGGTAVGMAGVALAGAAAQAGASVINAAARTLPPEVAVQMALRGLQHGVGGGSSGAAAAAIAGMAIASGAGGFIANELLNNNGGAGDPNIRVCPNCREKLRVPFGNSPSFQCGACGRIMQR